MNIRDIKTVLKTLIQNKTPVTPMLWARHGIGKSSAVNQLGKEIGYRVLTIILSQKEAVDVAGVLYTYEDEKLGMSVTSSHPPVWFADAVKNGKLIIFLDEFNMARREVLNAAFELVLDRRLNNVQLPDSVFIVCAGNPDDDRYDTTPLSESLRDRLMHIQVTSDTPAWIEWAKQSKSIHPDVIQFIQLQPNAAHSFDERDSDFPVEIKHSNRSWERVGLIHALPMPQNLKYECFRGIVGLDLATAFVKSLTVDAVPLNVDDVFELTKETIKKIKDWTESDNMRMDLLSVSVENVVTYCKDTDRHVSDKDFKNLKKFIQLLPSDLATLLIAGIYEIRDWSAKLIEDTSIADKIRTINTAMNANKRKAAA